MPLYLTAAADDDNRRLDRILRKALRDLPLSAIHRLLRKGHVQVDGKGAVAQDRVRAGQTIMIDLDLVGEKSAGLSEYQGLPPENAGKRASALPDILFEGAGLLVLNKPSGLVVHGDGSLEELVRSYLDPKIPPSLSFRPGPLHRLDKPSSGIIVFSANLEGARLFSSLIRNQRVKKTYLALVDGTINECEIWKDELVRDRLQNKTFIAPRGREKTKTAEDGKTALTYVTPLAAGSACTLVLAEIKTGRTHQIRAQAAFHGHPLLGDRKYHGRPLPENRPPRSGGGARNPAGLGFLLHAWRMEFPSDLPLPRQIEAPLPDYYQEKVSELFGRTVDEILNEHPAL